jgi:hypothetical protein
MNARARVRPTFVGRYSRPHIWGGAEEESVVPASRDSDWDKTAHKA